MNFRFVHGAVVVAYLLSMSAFGSAGVNNDNADKQDKAIAALPPTSVSPASANDAPPEDKEYCRKIPIRKFEGKAWFFLGSSLDDLVSESGKDYEIFENFKPPSTSGRIEIKHEHRFVLNKLGATISMKHTDKDGNEIGSSTLELDPAGPWAKGVARTNSDPDVGHYYVFRKKVSTACEHRNSHGGDCRRIHVEFFDSDDDDSKPHVPVIGKTVHESNEEDCEGVNQTDEGDGDEGPI